MSTTLPMNSDLSPEEREEHQAVLDKFLHGKPVPAEVERRIRERAASITDEIFHEHGLIDVAVPAIREVRDGLADA